MISFRTPLGIVADMSDSRQPVIAGAARTPVGRLLGALASKSASELGGVAIAAAVAAGIGMSVPALTVNKVCLSGLDAIALASQLIRLGEYDVVVAGGMESM